MAGSSREGDRLPAGLPLLRADDRFLAALAEAVAERVADRLRPPAGQEEDDAGYLNPEAAGRYIGASRRRINDLASAGLLAPDGRDGRTPLYRRRTLDDYVRRGVLRE